MENNNNIEDNFKNLAPMLFGIDKKNNFIVPENYFAELPEAIKESISLCIEVPLLSAIDKKNPFATPLNYFETLPSTIFNESIKDSVNISFQEKTFNFLFDNKTFIAYAASIILLVGGWFVYLSLETNSNNTTTLTLNASTEIDVANENMNESDLIEELYKSDVSANEITLDDSDYIANYLMGNNIDDSALINEL